MDAKSYFDIEGYFEGICKRNKFAQENKFHFCTCSGAENLQGPIAKFRTEQAFFCVDDTNDGTLFRGRSGGWFKNRTMTVFLLHRYKMQDMKDRAAKMDICRELFRQIASRMLVDEHNLSNDLIYLQTDNILSREFGEYTLSGCTGLYFMVDVAEPTDLVYDADEWIEI